MVRSRFFSAVSNHEASTFHPSRRDQEVAPQSVRMFRSRLENFVCDGLEDVDREVFRLSGCQNDGDLA
jgi:hypothetical protein